MTILSDFYDLQDVEIKPLQEILDEAQKPGLLKKMVQLDSTIRETFGVPLSSWLLHEHQINKVTMQNLAKTLGVPYKSLISYAHRLNVPLITPGEFSVWKKQNEISTTEVPESNDDESDEEESVFKSRYVFVGKKGLEGNRSSSKRRRSLISFSCHL